MKILELLDATLVLVDLEVNLGDNKQNSPTLCASWVESIGSGHNRL